MRRSKTSYAPASGAGSGTAPDRLPQGARGGAGATPRETPPAARHDGSLDAACARTVARAREAGRGIVLAVSERAASSLDPLAVLRELTQPHHGGTASGNAPQKAYTAAAGSPQPGNRREADGTGEPSTCGGERAESRFYWEHPAAGFALAAGGRALGWQAGGPGRFDFVRTRLEAALAEAEAWAPPGEQPLGVHAVGGFSFFDDLDEGAWPGFEPADLSLPAWAAVRHTGPAQPGLADDEVMHWLVQTQVLPVDEPAQLHARIEADLARLRAAGDAAGAASGEAGEAACGAGGFGVAGLDPPQARAHWAGVVRTARDAIRAGALRKVVLARALELVCTPAPDPLALVAQLRAAYPECVCFLADPGKGQAYLGATPERLARMEGGRASLAALAGTSPRGATPAADAALRRLMLESTKEREEHSIVVESIRAALQGCGRLELPEVPEVRALKNAWHLFTPIALEAAPGVSLLGLVERLHPTPAVGGLPRAAALDAIRRLESFDRGWYSGPLGWLNAHGVGEFAVTLRSGVVAGPRVRLFAGGGIVAESDPESEFEETRIKFQPLLDALGQESQPRASAAHAPRRGAPKPPPRPPAHTRETERETG